MDTIFSLRLLSLPLSRTTASRLAARCFRTLLEWDRRAHERAQLRALDDRALADLGLSRGDILREVDKRFWRS